MIAVTFVLAFEQLPLPKGVAPLEAMTFHQEGLLPEDVVVTLPDNWRSHPARLMEQGIYRSEFGYEKGNERWGIYIPNYSGQITVTVNDRELTTGGFLSGDLIPDQSVPYFAQISADVLLPEKTRSKSHSSLEANSSGF